MANRTLADCAKGREGKETRTGRPGKLDESTSSDQGSEICWDNESGERNRGRVVERKLKVSFQPHQPCEEVGSRPRAAPFPGCCSGLSKQGRSRVQRKQQAEQQH